jgi:hypothetical protein
MNKHHDGWALWQHIDSEDVILVFQVHGVVENAVLLTHPSIFHFDAELADTVDETPRGAFIVLWQEVTA